MDAVTTVNKAIRKITTTWDIPGAEHKFTSGRMGISVLEISSYNYDGQYTSHVSRHIRSENGRKVYPKVQFGEGWPIETKTVQQDGRYSFKTLEAQHSAYVEMVTGSGRFDDLVAWAS